MENNSKYNSIFIKNDKSQTWQRFGFWIGSTDLKYCSNCGQFILPKFDRILMHCNSCNIRILK